MNNLNRKLSQLYARDRAEAERASQMRRAQAYARAPRLKELADELRLIGTALSRLALGEGDQALPQALKLREEHRRIVQERTAILSSLNLAPTYFTDTHTCRSCKDTGFDESTNKRCACFKKKQIELFYGDSMPDTSMRFGTFKPGLHSSDPWTEEEGRPLLKPPQEQMDNNLRTAKAFAQAFPHGDKHLLLYGATGLGKTHLCTAIFNELSDTGYLALYVPAPDMFAKVEDSRFSRDADTQQEADISIKLLYEADLLIIDDLGSEFPTVVTNTELFNLLNMRLLQDRAMVISTNLTFSRLRDTYSERVSSRIMGNFRHLRFYGTDMRY